MPDSRALRRGYALYFLALVAFMVAMAALERLGLPHGWLAALILLLPVVTYASIGIACRTGDAEEYFVAGRRVPALYNGAAIAADWMSVASFMGLAGLLYVNGFGGLAYVLGWTGGFCLVAFYLAPYLRRSAQFTIPDFLALRYGGRLPRLFGIAATILCGTAYLVAQIYGVALITSKLTGMGFEVGVFLGLGGVLLCSFLGGMRAVTWTQVSQYLILAIALAVPAVWLALKQTDQPLPQAAMARQLSQVAEREAQLARDPREQQVIAAWREEAAMLDARLRDVPSAMAEERNVARHRVEALRAADAPAPEQRDAERALRALQRTEAAARQAWTRARAASLQQADELSGAPQHGQLFTGDPLGSAAERARFDTSRLNFVALVLCLMAGTAGLPHILARFYTTPSVRETRRSVTWALFFIVLVYTMIPVLAVALRNEVLQSLVGLHWDALPGWIEHWSRFDPGLVSAVDINHDGVLQRGEIHISSDVLVLAAPEIGGMPYIVTCLVAAGGLAAALSTADGLLLTVANALSHDLYFKLIDPGASMSRRVAVSKLALLLVALAAVSIALQRPAQILLLVTPVFSLAAATLFPVLVMGVFWRRANGWGACAGMLAGLAVTGYYLVTRQALSPTGRTEELWWGVQAASAGVFGMPVAFAVIVIVSLLTPAASASASFVQQIRRPDAA